MEYDVIVPKFDEDGTIVTVSKWYKSQGDSVSQGETIAEVDSNVATCEIIAPASGKLATVFIPEGKRTRLGAQIASIVSEQPAMSEYVHYKEPQTKENEAETAFESRKFTKQQETEREERVVQEKEEAKEALMEIEAEAAFGSDTAENTYSEQKLNKAVRALKRDTGKTVHEIFDELDSAENIHTHVNTQDDINVANRLSKKINSAKPATDPNTWKKKQTISTPDESTSPIGTIEKSISNRRKLAVSLISTVVNEIDMTNIIAASESFGESFLKKHGLKLGFTPFILKAVVKALQEFPMFNAYILDDEQIIHKKNYDIAIITRGLDSTPSPVIRNADNKTIRELQESVTVLSNRAEIGELTLEESSGATFTLVNAGTYGSLLGSDIVAYPQIAALTMHKVSDRAVVRDKTIYVKPMMYISMSFDHRIANSRSASLFLERVRMLSENLTWMSLEI